MHRQYDLIMGVTKISLDPDSHSLNLQAEFIKWNLLGEYIIILKSDSNLAPVLLIGIPSVFSSSCSNTWL